MRSLLLLLLCTTSAWADQGNSLLDFELRSLQQPGRHALPQYENAPILMMFFEPGCQWCFRQVKVLNKLHVECDGAIAPLAVGVNGSRRELLAEIHKSRPEFPAYEASGRLLNAIGGVPATPFTLVADAQGQPLGWLRGYMPEEELKPLLQKQFGSICPA